MLLVTICVLDLILFLTVPFLQTSGRGTGTPSQKDQDVQKENLKLSSENLELRLQLAQANVELPGLKVRYSRYQST